MIGKKSVVNTISDIKLDRFNGPLERNLRPSTNNIYIVLLYYYIL